MSQLLGVNTQLGLGMGGQCVAGGQPFGDMPGQAGRQALGLINPASSITSACGDSASSRSSNASMARSESSWLLTDTYSPDAIASAPANRPARPAVRIVVRDEVAPATPDNQAGCGDDPVVGAQDGGAQPVEPGRHAAAMRLGMPGRHGADLAHLITP